LGVPTFNNVGDSQSKNLASFGRAFLSVVQKCFGTAFNRRVFLGSRPLIACRAAFFAPTMIAICRLRVLEVQAKRLADFALEARFHVNISTV
jgi:hypothetical protein